MKALYAKWDCFGEQDILEAFAREGVRMEAFAFDKAYPHHNPELEKRLEALTEELKPDFLYSFNYFPVLSSFCKRAGLPYLAWVYDSPYVLLYSSTLINPCNRVFLFDHQEYEGFHSQGIPGVFYLPLAANPERLKPAKKPGPRYAVSFVGSLYTESHNFYDRMVHLSEKARGYLEGLMEAQLHLFGANLIAEVLPDWVIEEMRKDLPMEPNPDGVETLNYLFGEYVIGRKLTSIERRRTLEHIADQLIPEHIIPEVDLFTPDSSYSPPGIRNRGLVNYLSEMPEVFASSKINLNITLRSIHSGIPLRCFDILGCGGFLITNYQADLTDLFTPGRDLIVYEDMRQLPELIRYYLSHEQERAEIAEEGFQTVVQHHTWRHRVKQMLETL